MEHLTQNQFEAYCQSRLLATEILTVTDHLLECEGCRQRVAVLMSSDEVFLGLEAEISGVSGLSQIQSAPSHLTTTQTAAYVDNTLAGEQLQVVKDHLAICEPCQLLVADLASFKANIAPSIVVEYQPQSRSSGPQNWWQRTVSTFPSFFRMSPVPTFGAALALIVLAIFVWMIWRARFEREPKQEIALAPSPALQFPSPAPSATQSPAVIAKREELRDAERLLALDQQGNLTGAEDLPRTYQNLLKRALVSGSVERSSQVSGLSRPGSSLMSSDKSGATFSVTYPVGIVLLADHPTFRWTPMNGVKGYVVEVYDKEFAMAAQSPELTTTSWTVATPLTRGKIYSWQVRAIKEGEEIMSPRPPAPQAKFRILDTTKASEISKAKRAYPRAHLTLGLLYADAGLLAEAETELRQAVSQNPDSELVRKLLHQVQTQRRHQN